MPSAGGLSEIIVTAQRRAENLQDVPIAVSVITAEAATRDAGMGIVFCISSQQVYRLPA